METKSVDEPPQDFYIYSLLTLRLLNTTSSWKNNTFLHTYKQWFNWTKILISQIRSCLNDRAVRSLFSYTVGFLLWLQTDFNFITIAGLFQSYWQKRQSAHTFILTICCFVCSSCVTLSLYYPFNHIVHSFLFFVKIRCSAVCRPACVSDFLLLLFFLHIDNIHVKVTEHTERISVPWTCFIVQVFNKRV